VSVFTAVARQFPNLPRDDISERSRRFKSAISEKRHVTSTSPNGGGAENSFVMECPGEPTDFNQ